MRTSESLFLREALTEGLQPGVATVSWGAWRGESKNGSLTVPVLTGTVRQTSRDHGSGGGDDASRTLRVERF